MMSYRISSRLDQRASRTASAVAFSSSRNIADSVEPNLKETLSERPETRGLSRARRAVELLKGMAGRDEGQLVPHGAIMLWLPLPLNELGIEDAFGHQMEDPHEGH